MDLVHELEPFRAVGSFWFHLIGACAISLVVALSLVVLVDLSYPFSGSLVVSSDPFRTGVLAGFFDK